jgi:hypothetical protein
VAAEGSRERYPSIRVDGPDGSAELAEARIPGAGCQESSRYDLTLRSSKGPGPGNVSVLTDGQNVPKP